MSAPWENPLPTAVEIGGAEYTIRTDYRDILNIFAILGDAELDGQDKALGMLVVFYPDIERIPDAMYNDAVQRCFWFINGGDEDQNRPAPKLMDWEQDFRYIISPINRVVGQEVRNVPYMHWWTFLSAYYEIGECLFAQIVRIRDHLARGKPLDKEDRKWYRENRHLVDFKARYTDAEEETLRMWGVK